MSFQIIKNKLAMVVGMFSVNGNRPLNAYFNALGFRLEFPLLQKDKERGIRPLLYNALLLSKAKKNYGTYNRKLLAIIIFGEKYHYYFQGSYTNTFHTNHQLLVTFLNLLKIKGIYAR